MKETPEELARELLGFCLERRPWPEALLDQLIDTALTGSRALFSIVIEGLGDRVGHGVRRDNRLCGATADERPRNTGNTIGTPTSR